MKRNFDIEKVARAIEADMGEALPDIRTALAEVKAGAPGRVTTPEQILLRQARRTAGNGHRSGIDDGARGLATIQANSDAIARGVGQV